MAKKRPAEEDLVVCPVCRAKLGEEDLAEIATEKKSPQVQVREAGPAFQLPEEIITMREKMSTLFLEQQQKGGIIDIQGNQRRLVVNSATFISTTSVTTQPPVSLPFDDKTKSESKGSNNKDKDKEKSERKDRDKEGETGGGKQPPSKTPSRDGPPKPQKRAEKSSQKVQQEAKSAGRERRDKGKKSEKFSKNDDT